MHKLASRDNPYVKHLSKLIVDSAYREEHQKCVVMGQQLVDELTPLVSGTLFSTAPCDKPYVEISDAVAAKIGSSYFAEFHIPKAPLPKICRKILALDGVGDPGNLGTLLRTALALGWEGVLLLPGCCDPFNDKALRASKGALFKLPYKKSSWDDFDQLANEQRLIPVAADLHGAKPEFQEKCILILGSEGRGLSDEAKKRAKKITIPLKGEMESLNVAAAGAILMYLLGNHD